ncbi:SAM-dependent methyltransferase [Streptomyces sp. AC563]|uniref:SAM-dependent methyltransferase n=1 Tax=Streptomyces buecherae TaxID=2763006 RepID=UPI00164D2DC7|nr:SAM-dependent methyltransferase [Streptomyces buecherae]MBC3990624.1 SAM-dependent methyltransferase [Streptomyces buecherae]
MRDGANPDFRTIDTATPSVARMYDWLLGGIDHYEADRVACADLLEIVPDSQALALNNRNFLRRVVRYLAEEHGMRQFIDHGSGLPTMDNVHEVAQRVDPSCRVVYIDSDPIVLAHGRSKLDRNDRTAVLSADMRDVESTFAHPDVKRLIRPDEPTAALFVSVLHCIKDHEVLHLLDQVKQRLVPGSLFVICQLVSDRADVRDRVTDLMREATHDTWGRVRTKEDVVSYFEHLGLDVVEPGLMNVTGWRAVSDVVPRQRTQDWEEWGGVGIVR